MNTYLDALWARYGLHDTDVAGLSRDLISNAASVEQRAILDALPVLIFLEKEGRILFANREARLMVDEACGEWIERPIEEVLWGLLPGTAEPRTRLKGTRRSRPFHATMPIIGSRMMPIEGTYSFVGDSWGEAVIIAFPSNRDHAPKSSFMEDVLASLPEAVAIVRANRILYTNPAFTRMFGCMPEGVEGSNMSELMMAKASPVENAVLAALLEDHGSETFEATLRGPAMNLDLVVSPLMVNGELAGRVLTFREAHKQDGTGSWQLTEGLENHWGPSVIPFP
ncbi:MAG TPA: PAS domain-containing protein [Terracidiphilus sp.]|nr:PAS domain-containing protein [Terracidiphilus sp.]